MFLMSFTKIYVIIAATRRYTVCVIAAIRPCPQLNGRREKIKKKQQKQKRTSIVFSTFWLLAFSLAVCFAGYFISNIYHKYTNTPVIISFNPVSTSLLSIPFPAVTICNMNQAIKRKARQILKYGYVRTIAFFFLFFWVISGIFRTEIENKLLNDYCTSNNSFPNISIASDDASSNWEVVRKFLTKVFGKFQIFFRVISVFFFF